MARVIRGPSIEVEGSQYALPDVRTQIQDSIENDDESPEVLNRDLIHMYADAILRDRIVMDDLLIILCGYSMATLLEEADAQLELMQALKISPHEVVGETDDA